MFTRVKDVQHVITVSLENMLYSVAQKWIWCLPQLLPFSLKGKDENYYQ